MPRRAPAKYGKGSMTETEKIRHRKIASARKPSSQKSNNPWILLVNETRRKYPNISLKEAMIRAKPIYAAMKAKMQ